MIFESFNLLKKEKSAVNVASSPERAFDSCTEHNYGELIAWVLKWHHRKKKSKVTNGPWSVNGAETKEK